MSDKSSIEWTDATWNPTTGCTKIAPGCAHCYIVTTPAFRIRGRKFVNGSTDIQVHADRLDQPLHWKKPRRIFVNSLSDLFHEAIPDDFIGRVFDVMAQAPRHTFQVLTKRPERAAQLIPQFAARHTARDGSGWPLKNVHFGTSIANQHDADTNIPHLLQIPAAIRFLSVEPLIGEVSFRWARWDDNAPHPRRAHQLPPVERDGRTIAGSIGHLDGLRMLDWVIVGGESGAGARPCDDEWIRQVVTQCREAGVPVFVKQLGSRAVTYGSIGTEPRDWPHGSRLHVGDTMESPRWAQLRKKGGDWSEWPPDLRVRQFPEVRVA